MKSVFIIILVAILGFTNVNATTPVEPARLVQFEGAVSNNKVVLNWTIDGNNSADKFEVEKSFDGKTFKMAALVFGTDKSQSEQYTFFEKAGDRKAIYRIKMIDKDNTVSYSAPITVAAK